VKGELINMTWEIQKKLLNKEHNFNEALQKVLSMEGAEKETLLHSRKRSVNKVDSEGHPSFRPCRPHRPIGKG